MSSDLNRIELEGNLTRDPQLKSVGQGTSLCNFSIASNRFYKKDDGFEKETSFFDIQCWAGLAQDVASNCHKGSAVKVTGRLKQDRWTSTDGKNQSKIIIVAENVLPINRQRNSNNGGGTRLSMDVNPNTGEVFECPF